MALNPVDVIKQLEKMDLKITPEIRQQLIDHLSHPEIKDKIAKRSVDWKVPQENVAMTSAVIFLSTNKLIEDDIAAMLHNRLSENMRKIHKAGGITPKLSRSLAALLKMQRMRGALRRIK